MEQPTIYDFTANDINGDLLDFRNLKGKVLLVVNTASKCGFTKQYAELEQLYKKYHDQGLEIIAFPCNQFGNQEPDNADEIQKFCSLNYNVTFRLMQKIEVNGENTHPLYQFLKTKARGILWTKRIKWNFTKFLVNRDGRIIMRYSPLLKPLNLELIIQKLLG
jgi:glutathione peroxidase